MKIKKNNKSIGLLFQQALDRKLTSDISKLHRDSLRYAYNQFMTFLGPDGREMSIKKLKTSTIEEFLQRYNSSPTSYMNKRRELSSLLMGLPD